MYIATTLEIEKNLNDEKIEKKFLGEAEKKLLDIDFCLFPVG
jgi:hypothetical protein